MNSTKRIVARNVIWNWAGMAAHMTAGFIVAPFLVHRLGQTGYGLWILVASFTNYFGLLDMGVRGAVGRQIAYYRAKKDIAGYNATLNTALLILSGAGALAMLGTFAILPLFFRIFEVPPEHVTEVRLALILVGVNLVLWLPLNLFDAALWAHQRFDLINAVDIVGAAIRVGLTFLLIGRGGGLVALAVINILSLAGTQLAKGIVILYLDDTIRLGFSHIRRDAAKRLMSLGLWNSLLSVSGVVNGQAGPLIIGARMSVGLVTPFSIAQRLVGYGREFVIASTGVLTPVAIAFHAEKKHHEQRSLFIEGGKYCLALAVFFVPIFVILGRPIIGVWMGQELKWASGLLLILILGEALPMSQWVSYSILLGKYRHKFLGTMGLIENVTAIVLALVLVRPYGLAGVCVGFAIPATLCRGAVQLAYAGRLVGVSLRQYARQVALPVLSAAALPAAGLAALVAWRSPRSWTDLCIYAGAYVFCYLLATLCLFGFPLFDRNTKAARGRVEPIPPSVAVASSSDS